MERKKPCALAKNLWNASAITLSSHPHLIIAILFKYTQIFTNKTTQMYNLQFYLSFLQLSCHSS